MCLSHATAMIYIALHKLYIALHKVYIHCPVMFAYRGIYNIILPVCQFLSYVYSDTVSYYTLLQTIACTATIGLGQKESIDTTL